MKKGLYIVATPIGNLQDISNRAMEVLKSADVIACEDTRVTKKLFSLLGIDQKKNFISLHNFNEAEKAPKIIEMVKDEGKLVALVSDAGSPLISDPGYKLIRECLKEDMYICSIPGPCALVCALQLSGLPTDRFMFAGFIPNKDKARKDFFQNLKDIPATLVFYESANRILKTLSTAKEIFAGREMSVVREITKMYEEYITGSADEIIAKFEEKEPRGEMVFMVAPPVFEKTDVNDLEEVIKKSLKTLSVKDCAKEISQKFSLNKKEVYELALKLKDEK